MLIIQYYLPFRDMVGQVEYTFYLLHSIIIGHVLSSLLPIMLCLKLFSLISTLHLSNVLTDPNVGK